MSSPHPPNPFPMPESKGSFFGMCSLKELWFPMSGWHLNCIANPPRCRNPVSLREIQLGPSIIELGLFDSNKFCFKDNLCLDSI